MLQQVEVRSRAKFDCIKRIGAALFLHRPGDRRICKIDVRAFELLTRRHKVAEVNIGEGLHGLSDVAAGCGCFVDRIELLPVVESKFGHVVLQVIYRGGVNEVDNYIFVIIDDLTALLNGRSKVLVLESSPVYADHASLVIWPNLSGECGRNGGRREGALDNVRASLDKVDHSSRAHVDAPNHHVANYLATGWRCHNGFAQIIV